MCGRTGVRRTSRSSRTARTSSATRTGGSRWPTTPSTGWPAGVDEAALAEQRLAEARAAVAAAIQAPNFARARQAYDEQHEAERQLARVRGEQYAEPLDLGLRWDTGA